MQYVRLYCDLILDADLRSLTRRYGPEPWAVYTMCMCLAGRYQRDGRLELRDGRPLTIEEIADQIGVDEETVDVGFEALQEEGRVRLDGDTWIIESRGVAEALGAYGAAVGHSPAPSGAPAPACAPAVPSAPSPSPAVQDVQIARRQSDSSDARRSANRRDRLAAAEHAAAAEAVKVKAEGLIPSDLSGLDLEALEALQFQLADLEAIAFSAERRVRALHELNPTRAGKKYPSSEESLQRTESAVRRIRALGLRLREEVRSHDVEPERVAPVSDPGRVGVSATRDKRHVTDTGSDTNRNLNRGEGRAPAREDTAPTRSDTRHATRPVTRDQTPSHQEAPCATASVAREDSDYLHDPAEQRSARTSPGGGTPIRVRESSAELARGPTPARAAPL